MKNVSMKYWWDETENGKPNQPDGEQPVRVPPCPPENLHGLASDRKLATATESKRYKMKQK
jgi:hypothetical protein